MSDSQRAPNPRRPHRLHPHLLPLLGAAAAILLIGCEFAIPESIAVRVNDATIGPDAACIDADDDGVCAPADCDDADPARKPGATEICDGIDNDCDGEVDEGLNVGTACTVFGPGTSTCRAPGTVACNPLTSIPFCQLREEVAEVCNGVDDDCDGNSDEGNPGGGGPCDSAGVGACGAGTFVCSPGGALGCLAVVSPGQVAEICNGIDDDCDGVVDEASGGSEPGEPVGTAMVDECYGGPAGTAGVGPCTAGTWICANGQFTACVGEVRPFAPDCNTMYTSDSNCNGVSDHEELGCSCPGGTGASCYSGPEGTAGVGECLAGEYACGGSAAVCDGEVLPATDVCNGLDDDCDGQVDNGFNTGEACSVGLGTCAAAGLMVCNMDGLGSTCDATPGTPDTETCNGLDDDCDGRVDEVPGVGSECDVGMGACERSGVLGCDALTEELVCSVNPGPAVDEICNDIDDDCDGEVDEEFLALGAECTVGVGACSRTGTFICSPVNGTRICDVQPGGPSAEVCDSLDNDCDGLVDEGFGVGNACDGIGECGLGVVECNLVGGARCSTSQGGSQHEPVAESCNGLDDDCDGEVDENFYGLGNACYGCGSAPGVWECKADGTNSVCSTSPEGSATPVEICGDLLDNDCDYTTDEESCVDP